MKIGKFRILEKTPEPVTRAKAFSTPAKFNIWADKKRQRDKLRKYRNAYENGGYVSEAIDLYPLYMLSNGWTLQASQGKEELIKQVQATIDKWDFNQILWMLVVDSLLVMDGICEIVYGTGAKSKVPVRIYNRPAECFEIQTNAAGDPVAYIQKYDNDGNAIKGDGILLEPQNVIDLKLIPRSDSVYGMSLMRRAEDDINRDVESITSICDAIRIHGTPKYETNINANSPDAPKLTDSEFTTIEEQYKDINAKDSFVVEGDVKTHMLDVSGVTGVNEYSAVTLERVCAAMGVPEELLGLRKGSTDATAVSRIGAFFKKIQTFQITLAETINKSIIDRITGIEGAVWIEFADPDPSDNLKEAQFCETVGKINPLDPFAVMSREQMQNYLGIDKEEYANDNQLTDDATQTQ